MSSTSGNTIRAANATDNELCVFCHSTHNVSTTRVLWNHAASTVTSYNSGGTLKTSAGTPLPASMRTETKRCLSCHDGSVELGSVFNSGGQARVIPMTGGALVTASGKLNDPTYMVGVGGDMSAQHPVGIPYAGQTTGTYNGIKSSAGPADGTVGNYYAVQLGGCQSPSGYCTTAPTTVTNGLLVNLLKDSTGGAYGIECTTCHDPHNNTNGYFLRILESTGDGLCRSCHVK
ncbi:MAG TPA: cytochrome c3 family protein [Anaeromyxobacteraceae bacterium]|nr:cytochrome c3 family protein [Anaeromyxobacteraceae bacterium]